VKIKLTSKEKRIMKWNIVKYISINNHAFKCILILGYLSLLPLFVLGQVNISDMKGVLKLKGKTTCLIMKDTASPNAKEFKAVFRKYWTFSKIEFINSKNIFDNISSESSFLSFDATISGNNRLFDFVLWTPTTKLIRKKQFTFDDKTVLANIGLITDDDVALIRDPAIINSLDFDGEGHIQNWGAGILKNYIQQLMGYFEEGKWDTRHQYKNTKEPEKLKLLQAQTLYVPDYILNKHDLSELDPGKFDSNELCKPYAFKYELISRKELNKKITTENKSFYYLLYVRIDLVKYISIVDSQTGEIIYYTGSQGKNIVPDDFKKIMTFIK
jgi:hypothetical protein